MGGSWAGGLLAQQSFGPQLGCLSIRTPLQYLDEIGNPLSGGCLYTYTPGAPNTPKTTYTDVVGGTANANPVVLDSAGRANIVLDGLYYMELWTGDKDVDGSSLVWTQDNVSSVGWVLPSTAAGEGASLVGVTGFPGKSLADLFDGGYDLTVKTADLITKAPWVDVRAYASSGTNCVNGDGSFNHTSTADWGGAINAAYAALGTTGELRLAGGDYYFATAIGPFTGSNRVFRFTGSRLVWNGSTTGPAVKFGVTGTTSQYNQVHDLNVRTEVVDVDVFVRFQAFNRSTVYSMTVNSATSGESAGKLVVVDGCLFYDFYHLRTVGGYDHLSIENNGSSGSNAGTFYGFHSEGTGNKGIAFNASEQSVGVRFVGGGIESMTYGLFMDYPQKSVTVEGMYFEANGKHIHIANSAATMAGFTVRECYFKYNGDPVADGKVSHIEIAGDGRFHLLNNFFLGGSTEVPLVRINHASADVVLENNRPVTAGTAVVLYAAGDYRETDTAADGSTLISNDGSGVWHLKLGRAKSVSVPVADAGTATVANGSYTDVTFTEEFPAAPVVTCTFVTSGSTRDGPIVVTAPTATGVRIYNHSSVTSSVAWMAVYVP